MLFTPANWGTSSLAPDVGEVNKWAGLVWRQQFPAERYNRESGVFYFHAAIRRKRACGLRRLLGIRRRNKIGDESEKTHVVCGAALRPDTSETHGETGTPGARVWKKKKKQRKTRFGKTEVSTEAPREDYQIKQVTRNEGTPRPPPTGPGRQACNSPL
ncbi:hypothetical protein NDU88_001467 [Pleurodeles waltl]|uniref:Uncharacterized protein n=1 Tax=Pleurodeles waltl TaxID=8319 RepID=A0AAV7NDF5_PLEWA|nr:hypothetical protein NDU88_001467 [Pleurodeles waltl]